MNLTEAIENGIKVNESSFGRKNADSSYILIGAMDNEAKERYYYRLVVNRYESNNMGTYYVDDLYAVRAKKEETFTAVMPTRVTADADASNISSKLNVSDFLKAVKDYYGFGSRKFVVGKYMIENSPCLYRSTRTLSMIIQLTFIVKNIFLFCLAVFYLTC